MVEAAERIESVKAGTVAGLSVFLAYVIAILGNRLLLVSQLELLTSLHTSGVNFLVSSAIASISGFLFGVTYRYIIRNDNNSHLRDGAVLAFGLVRGLAQLDPLLRSSSAILALVVIAVQSILLFAFAAFILEWAIELGWIKRFNSD